MTLAVTTPEFESFGGFVRWALAQPLSALRPPAQAIYDFTHHDGLMRGIVLFRRPPFQVELLAGAGRCDCNVAPEHRHPNVATVEVLLAGDVQLVVRGRKLIPAHQVGRVGPDGSLEIVGVKARIHAGEPHGGFCGPKGALFLSLQHWINGKTPTSIGLDWEGPARMGQSHPNPSEP